MSAAEPALESGIRILVVGCGNMGTSHARAYDKLAGFQIAGLVTRRKESRQHLLDELGVLPEFDDYQTALAATKPDAVSINTLPDTHYDYIIMALNAGCHVFVEKPISETVAEAQKIADLAKEKNLKVVVGYILRHHPSWAEFVKIAQTLGKPLVMRMNLNQQNDGASWEKHKDKLECMSPIVDCGVHYVDIMCLMTQSRPVKVHAMGARLADDISENTYNYGQLQVFFADGSVGWYEAGWGTMVSETAYFVKDIIGPKGSVSIVSDDATGKSGDIDSHTKTNLLRVHHADVNADGTFAKEDEYIRTDTEPGHDELCSLEQEYFMKAIREDIDLSQHLNDAVNSLRIVLAADRSIKEGCIVQLDD
ncbi:MAG: Gfo/Idh/MocA family oxidoreductase [Planctomycetes bacterium]|nr:Gfo/Idh/MocA family oxidoreductase [Planctomycetota bacterium]